MIAELLCDLCDGTGTVFACSVHGAFISQNDVNTQKTCHLEHPLSRGRPCGEILHRNVECPGPDGNGHIKVRWCLDASADPDKCRCDGHHRISRLHLDPAKVKAAGLKVEQRWRSRAARPDKGHWIDILVRPNEVIGEVVE